MRLPTLLSLVALLPVAALSQTHHTPVRGVAAAGVSSFGNSVLRARLDVSGGRLALSSVENLRTHASLPLGEAFVLVFQDGRELPASAMTMGHRPAMSAVAMELHAPRAAAHVAGHQICTELADPQSPLRAKWCLIVRGQNNYLRQELTLSAGAQAASIADVRMFRFADADAKVVGKVAGSPVVSGDFFLGMEHPLSYSTADGKNVTAGLKRTLPIEAGQSITYSSVVGVARPGQMRRDFLAYVEQERAHPYRTFLHYNSWYDLGFGERYDAAGVLDRMNAFGRELVRKRGVTMDSFLLDDGWDDTHTLWGFDAGFPQGFTPLRATAHKYGFGIGVWLSPWGGYSREKQERIAYGTSQGYEIVKGGYALSGPKYYERFEQTCLDFITKYGVNQFKFDGTGNVSQVIPGSRFDSDFSAAIHLIERLRQAEPGLYVNLTTGTKPSPFWLRYADSIWRSGADHSFAGEGTWRQKWITYRDAQTYKNIVEGGPLYPLNSLMLHGLIYAKEAEHLSDDPKDDFFDEVHSYFGTGTQLQEMYITPSLLSRDDWDVLAESAKWSRRHASVLKDTHWVGGDPGKGEVYGWAAWNANSGILTLRNPSSKAQSITIDIASAFELPAHAETRYLAHSPWESDLGDPWMTMVAGHPHTFRLEPFEVLNLDAEPAPPNRGDDDDDPNPRSRVAFHPQRVNPATHHRIS